MSVTICTGWHPAGWDLYGKNFVETFDRHWPNDVRLVAYVEETAPIKPMVRYFQQIPVFSCEGISEFIGKHRNRPVSCGREPRAGWKPKDLALGYSWRFDAVRFCKQIFIPEHAADLLPDGAILAWFDADVVTFKDVPAGFIERQLGGAALVHLGRGQKHSELGFWAVRLQAGTRAFLSALADMYRSERVFSLREWHSAFVFDEVRRAFDVAGLAVRDLTPGGHGHIWLESPLAQYTDHLKGDRKLAGRSPKKERKIRDGNPYWT
jgi:hypothetical protein